jgi:hypothetical protein
MKKRLNLAMAIFLTILTTATILLFFYGVSYSKDALGYVTLISTAGYLAAGLYYHNYMEIKKQEDINRKIMLHDSIKSRQKEALARRN